MNINGKQLGTLDNMGLLGLYLGISGQQVEVKPKISEVNEPYMSTTG